MNITWYCYKRSSVSVSSVFKHHIYYMSYITYLSYMLDNYMWIHNYILNNIFTVYWMNYILFIYT
jgi:hypothetical protein